jgi:hypothetical protein
MTSLLPHSLSTPHLSNHIKATFLAFLFSLTYSQLLAEDSFSEVNNALFNSPHMQSIKVAGQLNYLYRKTETNKTNEDSVTLDITNISESGRSDQIYIFFTGENKKAYPPRRNIRGNGIFMMFLERDVHQLEVKTKGSWRHFQRRIRWAMAEGANKKEVEITYQGKKLKGIQYSIQPYANDKKAERYGIYANKYYTFTLSDKIPGTIYEVRTIVPKNKQWKDGDEAFEGERITLIGFSPSQKN